MQYECSDCGGWGAGFCIGAVNGSTDQGTFAEVIARAGIRNRTLGLITPGAAAYNATGLWSSASSCNCYAEAGSGGAALPGRLSAGAGQMARKWQQVVSILATAELKRRICACRDANERVHELQMDMALQSTETERYQRSARDLDWPFGTRLGHIQAWKMSSDMILRRARRVKEHPHGTIGHPIEREFNQTFIRAFTQRGGPSPSVPLLYAGLDEQYLMIGDISRPDRGGVNAINVQDPSVRGLFKRTGVTIDAPDIPGSQVTFKQKFGGVPWYKFRLNCPVNFYESEGLCGDPSDPLNGWLTSTSSRAGCRAIRRSPAHAV